MCPLDFLSHGGLAFGRSKFAIAIKLMDLRDHEGRLTKDLECAHAVIDILFRYKLQVPLSSCKLYQFGLLSILAYVQGVKTIHSKCHQTLVKLIKTERKRAGIQQAVVAKQMKKQQNWMSRLERGDRRIDVCQFFDLADLIGFDRWEVLRAVDQARNKRQRSK